MPIQKSRLTYEDIAATIPTLETEELIKLLQVLSSVLKKSVMQKKRQHSLIELEGLGAEVWVGVDVEKYICSERDSWN